MESKKLLSQLEKLLTNGRPGVDPTSGEVDVEQLKELKSVLHRIVEHKFQHTSSDEPSVEVRLTDLSRLERQPQCSVPAVLRNTPSERRAEMHIQAGAAYSNLAKVAGERASHHLGRAALELQLRDARGTSGQRPRKGEIG